MVIKNKDITERQKSRRSLAVRKDDKWILFAGRIVPVKGLYYLLVALSKIVQINKYIKLLIVGHSTKSQYIKVIHRLINHYKLQNYVIFTGYVPQKHMGKYYNSCDMVIVPSTYEPFGMVNIQALATNKPLITTDIVGSLEIIKNYPPLRVVPAFNDVKIEEAIIELLKSDCNIEFFEIGRASCRERV